MKIHHLNCGTMTMPTAPMVCHVLAVETDNGLVLVDSGYGTADCITPARTGPSRHVVKPAFRLEETAVHQLQRLGFQRSDVRHIVLTHFDVDHIGGLSDFPDAAIHVTGAEARGAVHAPSLRERVRYQRQQWAHGPKLVEHTPDGERWRGFAAAKELTDIGPGIVLIGLPGHTRGHACIAVDGGDRWILHAGDAFYYRGTLDGSAVPRALRVMESLFAFDRRQVHDNHARLAELYARDEPDLLIVSAHDPELLRRAAASS